MSVRQFKQLPYFAVEADGSPEEGGRVRKGICAVFGNVDSTGDRISAGAFSKTLSENGTRRVKFLWNHDFSTPPIASIKELREVGRDELPQAVLDYAPEATGGLLVSREYYDTPLADWVLQAIDKGDVCEMSFGYDVIRGTPAKHNGQDIRELKELRLYDASDVNWGANAATVAVGAKSELPIGLLIGQLAEYASEAKAGRRNAASDLALINQLHKIAVDLGCDNCLPDAGKSAEKHDETITANVSRDAAAASPSTALLGARLQLEALKALTSLT